MSSDPVTLPARHASDTAAAQSPFPPALMERVGFLLAMVRGGAMSICMSKLAPLGLHVKQFGLLTVLATEGPLSQQKLGEWTRHDRTTMVSLMDSLEERGLVRRERNPKDRRAYLLQLTPEGRRVQARAQKVMLGADDEILASLRPKEREQLLELLTKVAADIGRAPKDT
jgi:MarR family transcriptional regulator, lower aerobic nicotinate degradation pathway regulator